MKKRRVIRNKTLKCPECGHLCGTTSGLTRHIHKIHPITELSPETHYIDPEDAYPSLSNPDTTIRSPGITIHQPDVIHNISEYQGEESIDDDEESNFEDSDDLISVNSDNTDDTINDIESVNSDNTDDTIESKIISNDRGGHIYGSGEESTTMRIQRKHHMKDGHPFYPWSSNNELWISNLIYRDIQMSEATANKFLKSFSDGILKIEDVNINSMKQIYHILDTAEYVPVCI